MAKTTIKNIKHRGKRYTVIGRSTFTTKEIVDANDRYQLQQKQKKADKKKKK